MSKFKDLLATNAPAATVLIRLAVGCVFLSEGIQKFLYPAELGFGRFTKIGLPYAGFLGPFVGSFEAVCGSLVILGLMTRLAVVPLLVIISTAIVTTKFPIFAANGFWSMAHESRTDFAMLMGSLYLLFVGAGRLSVDANLRN
jgi:putative oxidoreductase